MNKQIILGDIHGRDSWKKVIAKHPDATRIIFIGDYLDNFEIKAIDQLKNLEDIITLKKTNTIEVILLIGNHDHHYWPGVGYSGTSGYQQRMAPSFEKCFRENEQLFQMCFVDEYKTVYSHAGFSNKFMQFVGARGSDKFNFINELFIAQPRSFCFYKGDHSGYGEHPLQSCIWIRPQTLYNCQIDNLQVIGHTSVNQINHPPKSERRGFYMIDALPRQYLTCIDEVFKIENV